MPNSIQNKLVRDAKTKAPHRFIFATFCPLSPENTSQFLINDYAIRSNAL